MCYTLYSRTRWDWGGVSSFFHPFLLYNWLKARLCGGSKSKQELKGSNVVILKKFSHVCLDPLEILINDLASLPSKCTCSLSVKVLNEIAEILKLPNQHSLML